MKNTFSKLFRYLDKIGKDKYQHFTLGAIIASLVMCVTLWLPLSTSIIISIISVVIAELFKEFVLDGKADYKDIIATILGGSCVWLPMIII